MCPLSEELFQTQEAESSEAGLSPEELVPVRAAPPARGHSCPPKVWLNYMFLIDLLPASDVESIMF